MKLPRNSFLLLRIAFLFVALCRVHAEEKEVSGEVDEEEEEKNKDYLYNTDDATPVVEYLKDEQEDAERPEFIFGKDNGPRVVEFYAPWCPHVRPADLFGAFEFPVGYFFQLVKSKFYPLSID